MCKTIDINGVKIGEGIPKICVPIVARTKEEIILAANELKYAPKDIVELRADFYDDIFDSQKVISVLKELKEILGDTPILFTFRTSNEGGEKSIDKEAYMKLNEEIIASKLVELVDVEFFMGKDILADLIDKAHSNNVKVIASNHDFKGTPSKDTILSRLREMQELGADIPKIAVMPNCPKDVLTLLEATSEMKENYSTTPFITMSMGKDGVITRLSGEVFGSCITFGAVNKTSAPGQINAIDLSKILSLIHSAL